MKAKEVYFHHIRDHEWRQVWCDRCGRMVNHFHEHHGRAPFAARPTIKEEE